MILRYSEQSKQDIRDIASYIAENNPGAAKRFFDAVEDTYSMLETFPQIGHTPTFDLVGGMQTVVVNSFKEYAIFYRVMGDVIRIDRVAYGKRDQPNLFKLENQ